MNSTTANPASGTLPLMGVLPRADTRKMAAADEARPGDFQRMLDQAAEKKIAANQQQARQLETRQADQRLQEHKLQEHKLQEQRQASMNKSQGDEATAPAHADQRPAQPVEKSRRELSSAQSPAADEDNVALSASAETSPLQPAAVNDEPQAAVNGVTEPAPELPAMVDANPDLSEFWRDGAVGEVAAVTPDHNLAVPTWVSLEELAQAVADLSGTAALSVDGALPGRELAAGMVGSALAAGFRSAPGAFYSNDSTSTGQSPAAPDGSDLADSAAPELNVAALSRQWLGASGARQATEQSAPGGQLPELSQDSGSGASRDSSHGSALTLLGQAPEGRSALLTPGAAPFNLSAGLRAGVGQPEWHNAIAERVAVMAAKNLTSAEIQLDPPELGQLLVRVTLNQEQANVTFASQHAGVREALDQTAHRLREMFDAEGLNLVNVDVSDRSFQQRQQQEAGALRGGNGGGEEDGIAEPVLVKQGQGLIDQFV